MASYRTKRSLERAVEDNKEQLQAALNRLGDCVKDEVDPRVRVARNPYRALAISFAVGFTLAVLRAEQPRMHHLFNR